MLNGVSQTQEQITKTLIFSAPIPQTLNYFKIMLEIELKPFLADDDIKDLIQKNEKNLNSFKNVDNIWQQLFDRLRAIDNTIVRSGGQSYRQAFIAGFLLISMRQIEEYNFLSVVNHLKSQITVTDGAAVPLTILEKRSQELNAHHLKKIIPLIDQAIANKSFSLDLSLKNLTRLPREIFENPAYLHFWENLRIFNCSFNHLLVIPEEIVMLNSLFIFYCDHNALKSLPDRLFKLPFLQSVFASCNLISEISNEHTWSPKLKIVDLEGNFLDNLSNQEKLSLNLRQPSKTITSINDFTFEPLFIGLDESYNHDSFKENHSVNRPGR